MSIKIKEIKNNYKITLHKVNEKVIGELPFECLVNVSKKIDDYSQIELRVKKEYYFQLGKIPTRYPLYDEIKNERLIGLNKELYVIKQVTEDEKNGIKTITAYSLEKKLEKINMDIKNEIGFYFIGSDEDRNIYNLNDFMYEETGWRFGHIDKELLYRKTVELTSSHYHYDYDTTHTFIKDDFSYRSYESLDKTWYDFINNDLKEQYECIVDYDNKNKLINLYHIDGFGDNFGLTVSYDNYIKSLEKTHDSSDIVTRLTLEGHEEDCIVESELVTGVNYVENYSYFMDTEDMSEELKQALTSFENACEKRTPRWRGYKNSLSTKRSELTVLQNQEYRYLQELPKLKEIVDIYTQKDMNEQANEVASQYQNMHNLLYGTETTQGITDKIAILENEIRELQNNILVVNNLCKKPTATTIDMTEDIAYDSGSFIFTEELLKELKCFIYSDIYTNTSFLDPNDLISAGKRILDDRCRPTKEWSLDIKDFTKRIDPTRFRQEWKGTLGLGDVVILLDYDKQYYEYVYVTEWTKGFQDGSLSITLSNKKSTSDTTKTIADVLKTAMNNNRIIMRDKTIVNNSRYNRI